MKVLITTDWYQPVVNGVVTSVMNLKEELTRQGHEVRILTLSADGQSRETEDVLYLGSLNIGRIYPNARMRVFPVRKWLEKLAAWGPDVVHSQCEFSTFSIAKKMAAYLNIPLVHTYHTIYEDYTHYFSPNRAMGRLAAEIFSRHVCSQADAIIAPSQKVENLLTDYGIYRPIRVIPTGINLDPFLAPVVDKRALRKGLGLPEEGCLLMYVGRLAKEKNLESVFETLSDWKHQIGTLPLKLVVVGDGPNGESLRALHHRLGLEEVVLFTGMVAPEQVADYYHAGDAFVTASESETQGLTYMEALASGLPVVCREDDCVKELIVSGQNGYTYKTEDGLLKALKVLCSMDRKAYCHMAQAARKSALPYSAQIFGQAVAALYDEAIAAHQGVGRFLIGKVA